MAIVNVDLSEYDAIRKRNSELEEQVKELKKLNDSLKQGAKVILRKETVVERKVDVPTYDRRSGLPTYKQCMCRDIVESSESFVNFEDVRLKVEQAMQDEVNRSIHDRTLEIRAYADKKNKLDNEYNGRKAELKKVYEQKERDFETEKNRVFNKLPNIASMATDLRDELTKIRFFKPKLAIKLANDIIRYSTSGTRVWTD